MGLDRIRECKPRISRFNLLVTQLDVSRNTSKIPITSQRFPLDITTHVPGAGLRGTLSQKSAPEVFVYFFSPALSQLLLRFDLLVALLSHVRDCSPDPVGRVVNDDGEVGPCGLGT